jgi:arylsulfatase A-like enzyme
VVIISVDPLRADGIHTLGNPLSVTPTIDALVSRGIVFTNAFSVSSWTLPSVMSFMTGEYPSTHKIINKELIGSTEKEGLRPAVLSSDIHTLASVFKANGYATGGFAGGAALSSSYGFDKGFDTYQSDGDFEGLSRSIPKALKFAQEHVNDKVFIYLHGFDTHGQFIPEGGLKRTFTDPAYKGTLTGSTKEQKSLREEGVIQGHINLTAEDVRFLRAIYDEKISDMDKEISAFMSGYNKLHTGKKTMFVITSNHGDEFYEHGRIDHGMTLYNEVLQIPLIIVLPGESVGKRVSSQVRNIDVFPTVLSLVGIPEDSSLRGQLQGVSLIPAMRGENQRLDIFAETSYRYATFKQALITWEGWKLITDQESLTNEVFNLRSDPRESHDVSTNDNAKTQHLRIRLLNLTDGLFK